MLVFRVQSAGTVHLQAICGGRPPQASNGRMTLARVLSTHGTRKQRTREPRGRPAYLPSSSTLSPGAGIMEADDRQVTTDFTVQTVIPPSTLDKPSIMKRYHHRRTCSHSSPRRSPTMITLHDTRFVECRWWNDGWTVKNVVT